MVQTGVQREIAPAISVIICAERIAMQKYLSFKGRAGRNELWIVIVPLMVVGGAGDAVGVLMHNYAIAILSLLAVLWPSIALAVRRWHDLGRSGWSILLQMVPIVGIWCIYLLVFRRGEQGDNRFGADPVQA
jgi:uncharacterized membrane protein YhaH (DUF805 family)